MQSIVIRQQRIATAQGELFAQSWTPAEQRGTPIVLLHDSLGCVALWRDFPEQLAQACGRRVIAYDRLGFGRSAPYPGRLPPSFIEDEARGGFQALCQQLGLERFVLLGHSVGGGMAVACAGAMPQACEALISESAQSYIEAQTLDGIRAAERQFAEPGQLERLGRYHGDKAHWVLRACAPGSIPGSPPSSPSGTWTPRCNACAACCWPCTATATSTARRARPNASPPWPRAPRDCASSPTAAMYRTESSHRRSWPPSPNSSPEPRTATGFTPPTGAYRRQCRAGRMPTPLGRTSNGSPSRTMT